MSATGQEYTRYKKLNWQAYTKHGTVECRHHSASIDFVKISNWICLIQGLIERAMKVKKIKPINPSILEQSNHETLVKHEVERLMKVCSADRAMRRYFRGRSEQMMNRI